MILQHGYTLIHITVNALAP